MHISNKEFLDIQTIKVSRFTVKGVRHMTETYNQMHPTDKNSQLILINSQVWLKGWVFIQKLSGCKIKSKSSHLNLFRARSSLTTMQLCSVDLFLNA